MTAPRASGDSAACQCSTSECSASTSLTAVFKIPFPRPWITLTIGWHQDRRPDSPLVSGPIGASLIKVKTRIYRPEEVGGAKWLYLQWQQLDREFESQDAADQPTTSAAQPL